MGFTNRISLADWQEYKKTEISLDVSPKIIRQKTDHEDPTGMIDDHYTHDDIIKIELKNGPYDSIESAKNEVLDFIRLLNTRAKSEVKHSVTFSLSPDKTHLIGNVVRYSTHNLHRPNVEAGAPEDTGSSAFADAPLCRDLRGAHGHGWDTPCSRIACRVRSGDLPTPR